MRFRILQWSPNGTDFYRHSYNVCTLALYKRNADNGDDDDDNDNHYWVQMKLRITIPKT